MIFFKQTARNMRKIHMTKKPKPPTTPTPDETIDVATIDRGADDYGHDDVPPHDEVPDADDSYYADDGAEPDVDYLPEEGGDDGREEHKGVEGDSLLTPDQLKALGDTAEQMRRPHSYVNFSENTGYFTVGSNTNADVAGLIVTTIPDYMVSRRSLWVGGKSVESHDYFLAELKGAKPPRPPTFTDRARWAEYNKDKKAVDPWNNFQNILPMKTKSGAILTFQSSPVTRTAIGDLLASFIKSGGKRRLIAKLTSERDTDTGKYFPVLVIIGHEDHKEDFGFLREMILRDDPEFPEPVETKWTSFGDE
jgi:hypothetical protein